MSKSYLRYPSECEKRPIEVSITSWRGISLGADHWYCKVKQRKNQKWDEDNGIWVDTDEGAGYKFECEVMREAEAVELAKYFIKLIAGKEFKKYHIVWSGPGSPKYAC